MVVEKLYERYKVIQRDTQTVWLADLTNCCILGKYAETSIAQYYVDVLNEAEQYHDMQRLQELYDIIIQDNYENQKGKPLSEVQKDDLVIWKQSAAVYTTEIVQDTYNKTHILVQNRKFRRSDGREVGVRQGTTVWLYCKVMQFNQRILDNEEYVQQHQKKIWAIQHPRWSKLLGRDVDEIYTFLKSKGVIDE